MAKKGKKRAFKNLMKVPFPFSNIPPGKTKVVEIIGPDDIHFRGVELGLLKEVPIPKARKKVKKKVKKKR